MNINPEQLQQLVALQNFNLQELETLSHYLTLRHFAANELVLQEGQAQREMYFLLEGDAQLCRGGLQLGLIHQGAHFGELGLISGRIRAATVKAQGPLTTACLDLPQYQALQQQHPLLAVQLQSALISQLGLQLGSMSDAYGRLLQERSLPRQDLIKIHLGDEIRTVPTGTPARAVLPTRLEEQTVVAALLNDKLVSLNTPLMSEVRLAPLSVAHWEGDRVYRHSASLLLLEAAYQLDPELGLHSMLSVGPLHWFALNSNAAEVEQALQAQLARLQQQGVNFRQEQWAIEEAISYFEQSQRPEAARLLTNFPHGTVSLASCGDYYVLSTGPLVPDSSFLGPLQVQASSFGLVLRTAPESPSVEHLEAYANVMQGHDRWLQSLGIHSVGSFNQACLEGRVNLLIRVAEGFHEKRLGQIADQISARHQPGQVICIAGPSSSGKSTFIQRLSTQLLVNGLEPVTLSLDDYYRNREEAPRDANGELNFECLEALDLSLLHSDLRQLLTGEPVATAHFDFVNGKSLPGGGPVLQLKAETILLLEGIHGLNPALIDGLIPAGNLFRIFIQPMASLALDEHSRINPSDLRLLRRIVRDRHQRATSAAENILRWTSVRAGEQEYIFPFVNQADVIFDSSLIYELAVLKIYAERYLLEVPRGHPAYATALRLLQLVQLFVSLYPDTVPPTSILREFVKAEPTV